MVAPPTPHNAFAPDLPRNLRFLCGFHASISDVCRTIGINRHQFSKYTSGMSIPSLHNANRIADFFGLDVEELCMPHEDLRRIFRKSPQSRYQSIEYLPSIAQYSIHHLIDELGGSNHEVLERYGGNYFRYNFAFDGSSRIIRSLFCIINSGSLFLTRHIERVQHRSNGSRKLTTIKYDGVVTVLSSCLFVVEFERLMKSCVAHAAFPCIQRPTQKFLTGVQSSLATSTGRPAASRVVLERIPASTRVRDALRTCGTFDLIEGEIDPDVIRLIGNRVSEDGDLLGPSPV